nr:glutathione S-transferase N-terminal domain-containing protein [Sphingomonas sp. CDS-1]
MIELFGANTKSPNVLKVIIALEEFALPYESRAVDVLQGEQFKPEFLAISPNNKIPAIIDNKPSDGKEPLSLFESGAILIYLAEKAGKLLPSEPRDRSEVLAWLMWQMGGQGPMLGQANHFCNFAPEGNDYGIKRYIAEAARLYRVLDTRLAEREFIANAFSIADIACWPWILFRQHHRIDLEDFPNVARWFTAVRSRPSVIRAIGDFEAPPPARYSAETNKLLFNIEKD